MKGQPSPDVPDEILSLNLKFSCKNTEQVEPRGDREEGLLSEDLSQTAAKSIQPHQNLTAIVLAGNRPPGGDSVPDSV